MNEECEKEFELWLSNPPYDLNKDGFQKHDENGMWPYQYKKYDVQLASEAWNQQQEKIDAQAKEIKALRGFANSAIEEFDEETWISSIAKKYCLLDENANPTKLLKGDK